MIANIYMAPISTESAKMVLTHLTSQQTYEVGTLIILIL